MNEIIPKFSNFRVRNLHLKTSVTCHTCQMKLLREEKSVSKSKVKTSRKISSCLKEKLERLYM